MALDSPPVRATSPASYPPCCGRSYEAALRGGFSVFRRIVDLARGVGGIFDAQWRVARQAVHRLCLPFFSKLFDLLLNGAGKSIKRFALCG